MAGVGSVRRTESGSHRVVQGWGVGLLRATSAPCSRSIRYMLGTAVCLDWVRIKGSACLGGGRPSLLGRKFLGKKRGPEEPLILLSAWLDGGFEFRAYRRSAEPEILGFHSLHFKPVDELCNLKGFSGFFIADGFGVLKCSPD